MPVGREKHEYRLTSHDTNRTPCQLRDVTVVSIRLGITWGVQVVRYPIFFSGMEADRNVKVVGGDVAVL